MAKSLDTPEKLYSYPTETGRRKTSQVECVHSPPTRRPGNEAGAISRTGRVVFCRYVQRTLRATLELWASSLRAVRVGCGLCSTQERVGGVKQGLFLMELCWPVASADPVGCEAEAAGRSRAAWRHHGVSWAPRGGTPVLFVRHCARTMRWKPCRSGRLCWFLDETGPFSEGRAKRSCGRGPPG